MLGVLSMVWMASAELAEAEGQRRRAHECLLLPLMTFCHRFQLDLPAPVEALYGRLVLADYFPARS